MQHPDRADLSTQMPRIGGDMALLRGIAKAVLEEARTDPKAIDAEFIARLRALRVGKGKRHG